LLVLLPALHAAGGLSFIFIHRHTRAPLYRVEQWKSWLGVVDFVVCVVATAWCALTILCLCSLLATKSRFVFRCAVIGILAWLTAFAVVRGTGCRLNYLRWADTPAKISYVQRSPLISKLGDMNETWSARLDWCTGIVVTVLGLFFLVRARKARSFFAAALLFAVMLVAWGTILARAAHRLYPGLQYCRMIVGWYSTIGAAPLFLMAAVLMLVRNRLRVRLPVSPGCVSCGYAAPTTATHCPECGWDQSVPKVTNCLGLIRVEVARSPGTAA
jgi:hypothetical protein